MMMKIQFKVIVFVPLTLLVAVNAGLLSYGEAPSQAVHPVQHVSIQQLPVHHLPIQQLPLQHIPVQHAAVPVQHFPIQEHVHIQNVPVPAPTSQIVSVQKTIVKEIEVPYPVDKYVKVDRHISVPVDRYIRVDRPYEVIKYVQEPYIVRVERPYHLPIETKVSVPKPIVEVEPILSEPQHIVKEVESKPVQPHNEYLPPPPAEPKNKYLPPKNEYIPPAQAAPQPENLKYLPPKQNQPETKSQFVPPPPLPQPLPRPEYLPASKN
ncbi:uncharacterized protein LOC129567560 [Sitodiplosis mosellana]|uniref:uncharacterized protein LOC129567560 n=1 Tax=Sitodiplosis mosellana TaxID=263140 RepID=UPI002444309D|nr:uncharacterized protein LOC129567560 [Sitodiplosis mosellana]